MLFQKNKAEKPLTAPSDATDTTMTSEPASMPNKAEMSPTASTDATDPATTSEPTPVPDKVEARDPTDGHVYPSGLKLVLLLASVFVSMFLVALDRLIIATAIPQITDDFHSITDIGWYGSAFLLSTCAFQLLFGKLYTVYSIKIVFLLCVLLFEIGSTVSGAAPNSIAFIVGRAIAGVGAAGLTSGAIVVIVHSLPLHKRPMIQGLFGAVFAIASVAGPLLGGVFTTEATWRWCFYINLPLGGVAALAVLFLLDVPPKPMTKLPTKAKLAQLDVFGTSLIVPGSVCLLLALQWGGLTYAWNNGRIIALLVLAGVLLVGFCFVQVLLPKTATLPPRIFKHRSIIAGFFFALCNGSQMMIFGFYLPLWFQAIQGVSAVESGIRTLPMLLSQVVATILTGIFIQKIGYYTPFMIAGVCLMSIGAGLLYTLEVDTTLAKCIGFQIIYGWGMGLSSQSPNLAAQTVLTGIDVPIGTTLMFFGQLLGGAVFVSVGQNVLQNELLKRLSHVPGFSAKTIQDNGATSLINLPASTKHTALVAYNESIRQVFIIGLILVCLSMLGALAMEWRSVKKNVKKPSDSETATPEAEKKAEGSTRDASTEEKGEEAKDRA